MSSHLNIKVGTHFIILTSLADGIKDMQFKHIGDYIDALDVLRIHNCTYTGFQANKDEYHHIFTNEVGLTTLSVYYQ